MRVLAALILVTTVATAAPAPLPMPGLTPAQEAQLKSAEADLAEARRLHMRDLVSSHYDPKEWQERAWKRSTLSQSAAEKLTRLEAGLGRVAAETRNMVVGKAGRAWLSAGDHAKALEQLERVISRSRDARLRVDALQGAVECVSRLGRRGEARRLVALARDELPRLGPEERKAAEQWLALLNFSW